MIGKQKLRLVVTFAFGFLILAYLFWSMGVGNITRLLFAVRPDFFIYAAVAYFSCDVLSAYALKIVLNKKLRMRRILPSHMCGMLYSAVTPGRVGYYYTAFALAKKSKESRSKNVGILTFMQGLMFLIKVLSCLIAVIYLSARLTNNESRDYLILASLVPMVIVVLIGVVLYTNLMNRVIARVGALRWTLKYVTNMQQAVKEVSGKIFLQLLLINILGWFLTGLQWFFLAQALSLSLTYWDAFMIQPLLSAVMFVPFTPGGLGITEGGSALLFTLMLTAMPSVEAKAAGVTFVLLTRINSMFVDAFGLIDMRIHIK